MQAVLLFGGTFDPPHLAHTRLPPLVARTLGCERIIYIPTSANPLKDEVPTAAEHRLAMLQRAVREVPGAEIDTIELFKDGPAYTVNTVEELHRRFGGKTTLRLLIGSDQALDFHRWKHPHRILELVVPAVMVRPPYDRDKLADDLRKNWPEESVRKWLSWTVNVPEVSVSASEIRRRITDGEDVSDLLDKEVLAYIRRHGLYGSGGS